MLTPTYKLSVYSRKVYFLYLLIYFSYFLIAAAYEKIDAVYFKIEKIDEPVQLMHVKISRSYLCPGGLDMAGRFEGLTDMEWKLFEDIFPAAEDSVFVRSQVLRGRSLRKNEQ